MVRLLRADQEERAAVRRGSLKERVLSTHDRVRRRRVLHLLKGRQLLRRADELRAAMILQHGETIGDFAVAHLLALDAHMNRVKKVRFVPDALWLAAAAQDRFLVNIGRPQRFGTQFRPSRNGVGVCEVYPIDRRTSEALRRRWHVPRIPRYLLAGRSLGQRGGAQGRGRQHRGVAHVIRQWRLPRRAA